MKPHWYHWQDDSLFLHLHVTTCTRRDEFKGLLDNKLCPIPKPPVEGKANQYPPGLIAREFKVSKSRAVIIAGSQSRDKCVAIRSPDQITRLVPEINRKKP